VSVLNTSIYCANYPIISRRRSEYWKWYRFSQESQSVLIYGFIPANAVLASIPLLSVLEKLPSYFLQSDFPIKENPLHHIAWDYAQRKPSYRQFCQDMSNRFLNRQNELRMRDATGGAVRLALAFLGPWFHELVTENVDSAIDALHVLAFTIAQWPGQWWVREHPELQRIILSITLAIGEELRGKYERKATTEVLQLQEVIEGLEKIIKGYERARITQTRMRVHWEAETPPPTVSETPQPVVSEMPQPIISDPYPLARARPVPLDFHCELPPQSPIHFETPITPPASPRHSLTIPTTTAPAHRYVAVPLTVSFQPLTPPREISQGGDENISSAASSPSPSRPGSPQSPTSREVSQYSPPPSPKTTNPLLGDNLQNDEAVVSDALSQPFVGLIPVITPAAVSSALGLPGVPSNVMTEWPFSPKVATPLSIIVPAIVSEVLSTPASLKRGLPVSPAESTSSSGASSWSVVSKVGSQTSPLEASPSISLIEESRATSPLEESPATSPLEESPAASPIEAFPATTSSSSLSTLSSKGLSPIAIPTSPFTDQASKHSSSSASSSLPSTPSSFSFSPHLNARAIPPVVPSQPPSPIHEKRGLPTSLELVPPMPTSMELVRRLPPFEPQVGPSTRVTAHDLFLPPRPTMSLITQTHHLHEALSLDLEDEDEEELRQSPVLVETAGFLVTGFLIGAFITLFLVSTQRRTLIYLT
jgi:hypothetical protein